MKYDIKRQRFVVDEWYLSNINNYIMRNRLPVFLSRCDTKTPDKIPQNIGSDCVATRVDDGDHSNAHVLEATDI